VGQCGIGQSGIGQERKIGRIDQNRTEEQSPAQMHTPHASRPEGAVLGHYEPSRDVHVPVDFMVLQHTWIEQYREKGQSESVGYTVTMSRFSSLDVRNKWRG
jgi:hypothetical protein